MSYSFDTLEDFDREARRLSKHYASFKKDLTELIEELAENPMMGVDLGRGFRKVRMKIRSKGKGKSGGARVITNTADVILKERKGKLTLMYIYDKSERSSVSDAFLLHLREKLMP